MIRLNRMTDYGVVVLAYLAEASEPLATAPEIAAATGFSQPTVAKLLKKLAQGGLALSHRGVNGGYALARAPEEISMATVVEVLDGPVALTPCVTGDHDGCDRETLCAFSGRWNKVNAAIRSALEKVTLADMMPPFPLFSVVESGHARQSDTDAQVTV